MFKLHTIFFQCLAMLACLLVSPAGAQTLKEYAPREYTLGAGDVVRIQVFQNPDLSSEARVTESGTLSFPLVGSVAVGGLTIAAAEKKLAQMLKEGNFVLQPQVTMLLVQIRGSQVAVLGQVNRAGRYPLETFTTRLTDVLSQAGGIAPAGADKVVLSGVREGKPMRREIDVPAMFASADFSQDMILAAGDTIFVDRAPTFYIYGEVQRPGNFRLERDMSVMQGLAMGGGITLRGTIKRMVVHRRGSDGSLQIFEPELETRLQANDVIFVRESLF